MDDGERGIFEVEKILAVRKRAQTSEYLVHWAGYSSDDDTWEPESNLVNCKELLREFLADHLPANNGTPRGVARRSRSRSKSRSHGWPPVSLEPKAESPSLKLGDVMSGLSRTRPSSSNDLAYVKDLSPVERSSVHRRTPSLGVGPEEVLQRGSLSRSKQEQPAAAVVPRRSLSATTCSAEHFWSSLCRALFLLFIPVPVLIAWLCSTES